MQRVAPSLRHVDWEIVCFIKLPMLHFGLTDTFYGCPGPFLSRAGLKLANVDRCFNGPFSGIKFLAYEELPQAVEHYSSRRRESIAQRAVAAKLNEQVSDQPSQAVKTKNEQNDVAIIEHELEKTNPQKSNADATLLPRPHLYFGDLCGGPGSFSQYLFFRRRWTATGFGFTLTKTRGAFEWNLNHFGQYAPCDSFHTYSGTFAAHKCDCIGFYNFVLILLSLLFKNNFLFLYGYCREN